jgi:hypothetical protein
VMSAPDTVESVNDLVDLATSDYIPSWPRWFRGQSALSWPLIPKVWRDGAPVEHELIISETFRTYAHSRAPQCPGPTDTGGWLSLMQHYGAPTRLLDWSESPLIAAYFATDPRPDEEDGALFMTYPKALNRTEGQEDRVLTLNRSPSLVSDAFVTGGVPPTSPPARYRVVAVVGDEVDRRQAAQRSVFTIHSPESRDLLRHEKAHLLVARYRIPHPAKETLRTQLEALGICRSTVFPDLQGLGDYLRECHERRTLLT